MPVSAAQLYDLYLAYFGRPPDVAGMRYYLEGDFQLEDVVRGFSASPESVALNGSAFGAAQVNAIYQNLFNRDAEPAGLAYWQNEVASGRLTPAAAALGILQGAQNADLASVQNKVTVARAFVEQLDTDRELAGYSGANAAALARAFLKTVDSSASSVVAAQTALPAQVGLASGTATPPGGGSSPPPVFGVSKDGSDIVSFTAAGAQIGVTEAGGTWTFTSGTSTATVTGTVAGYVVPASTTLSISSALASGKVFSGTGTALVVADDAGENLTGFTATGVGGFQLASGQNYTLTAAQAGTGRIGAAGAAGSLTDAGTITVRDTLAALGGGVAATLKANGADSIIASTTAGADISAITVAGIDSIVLVAGNHTLTAAQAALVDGATGSQTLTLTTLASGVLAASVESFVLGNFANAVTLGTAAQNVSAPVGTATTLTIGGTSPTGTWALANGADVLVATTGANLTGVNAGAATSAENLTLTGAITMTRNQHEALAITAASGSDAVTITTTGIVTVKAGVESYTVSQAGTSNTVSLASAVGGANITGGIGAATVVINANTSATGNWSLKGSADGISAFDGVNISGVNGGAATTAENLTVNGAISMTRAQHMAFSTVTASGGSDSVKITDGGSVKVRSAIETYAVSGGGANNISLSGGGSTHINGDAANATTVTVGSSTVSGTWSLLNAQDTIVVGSGSIAGVNSGGATTAEKLTLTGGVTMTQAQAAGLTDVTATGGSDSITVTTGGAVTARAGVETYTVSAGASNNVSVLAATGVNGNAANATTVSVGGSTVTGVYALSNAADVLEATTGANIAGATTSTVERLVLTGTITMLAAQYTKFNTGGITAAGGSDRIILTTALTSGENLNAAVENFTLAAANNSVTLGASQSIDAQALAGGQTLTLAGAFGASVTLGDGNLSSTASGAITVTGGTGANTIILGIGNDTVNAGDGDDLITGGTGNDTLNGQNGNDTFLYGAMSEFVSANALLDLIDGGNDIDTVEIAGVITFTVASDLTRMTNVEQIKTRSQSSTTNTHSIVVDSDVLLGGVTTIDLSGDTNGTSGATLNFTGVTNAMTLKGVGGNGTNTITGGSGADTLSGGSGNNTFRGGAGGDSITTSNTGVTTYVFEGTASANGLDTLTGVRSNATFDFSAFLGGAGQMLNAVVDATVMTAGLDLANGKNIGVRYADSSLSTADILLATSDGVAGEVAIADNGKAVVFSFGTGNSLNSANGTIYYVEDTDAGAGQNWSVFIVGMVTGSYATVNQMVTSVTYA